MNASNSWKNFCWAKKVLTKSSSNLASSARLWNKSCRRRWLIVMHTGCARQVISAVKRSTLRCRSAIHSLNQARMRSWSSCPFSDQRSQCIFLPVHMSKQLPSCSATSSLELFWGSCLSWARQVPAKVTHLVASSTSYPYKRYCRSEIICSQPKARSACLLRYLHLACLIKSFSSSSSMWIQACRLAHFHSPAPTSAHR